MDETSLVLPETAAAAAQEGTLSGGTWPYVLRMVLTLALVVAAIYGVFRILKRANGPALEPDPFVRILAATRLGPGKWLHVVSLGEKAWLVGSTEAQINLLGEVDDKELVDAMALRAAQAPSGPRTDFASLLQSMLKHTEKGRAAGAGGVPGTDFLSRQKERLRKLKDR